MSDKKGFFGGIFKGWGAVSEEEKQQREYALSKEKSGETDVKPSYSPNQNGDQQEVITAEVELFCMELLEDIIRLSGFSGKVKVKKKDRNKLFLEVFDSGDDAGRIIGKGGATLESMQLLIKHSVIRKFSVGIRIQIDAGDFRNKRHSQLKAQALKAAEEVIAQGDSIALEPMNATERRVVHMLFEKDEQVESISEGEGQDRHIVLVKR